MAFEMLTLEERVSRLEAGLPQGQGEIPLSSKQFLASFLLASLASYSAYRGLGTPNHPYQGVLAAMAVGLAYHRRWLRFPTRWHQWAIALLNVLTLAMVNKLLIGSGIRQPFHWMKYPALNIEKTQGKWFEVMPQMAVQWVPISIAEWQVDLTLIQTFLLLVTLIGALFRFQPFVSLTAFFLILVSIPAFATFDWQWVFPALAMTAVAFYIQTTNNSNYRGI